MRKVCVSRISEERIRGADGEVGKKVEKIKNGEGDAYWMEERNIKVKEERIC